MSSADNSHSSKQHGTYTECSFQVGTSEFGIKPSARPGSRTSARLTSLKSAGSAAVLSAPASTPIAAATAVPVASAAQASNRGKAASMSADTIPGSEAEAQHGNDSQRGHEAKEEQSSSEYDDSDSDSQNPDFRDAYACLTQLRDVMRGVDIYITGLEHGADVKQHAVYLHKRLDRIEPVRMTGNLSLNQVAVCCSCFKAQVEETLKAVQPDCGLHASATGTSSSVSLSEPKSLNATTLAILEDILHKHSYLADAKGKQDKEHGAGQLSGAPGAISADLAEVCVCGNPGCVLVCPLL